MGVFPRPSYSYSMSKLFVSALLVVTVLCICLVEETEGQSFLVVATVPPNKRGPKKAKSKMMKAKQARNMKRFRRFYETNGGDGVEDNLIVWAPPNTRKYSYSFLKFSYTFEDEHTPSFSTQARFSERRDSWALITIVPENISNV